ncbi:MAG: Uma2 family endonuclease [Ardenticatenales bacterium]|nr:Uma2 family endonuclease [Ardenticatenales bacterium]
MPTPLLVDHAALTLHFPPGIRLSDDEFFDFCQANRDRSTTDSLKVLKEKMEEYIANGVQLGWLLDPEQRQLYVYQPDQTVDLLNDPKSLSGEATLPGFAFDLLSIWEPGV